MPTVMAPRWGGTMASTNLLAGEADRDARMAIAMKMAALQHEMDQRSAMLNTLQQLRQERAAKAAAAKKSGGWGGVAGAGAGAALGAILAVPTFGLSIPAGMAIGGGLGATIGGGIDSAMGNDGSGGAQLGRGLMDFSTGFERMQGNMVDPNKFYAAPYPEAGSDGGQMGGGRKDDWM